MLRVCKFDMAKAHDFYRRYPDLETSFSRWELYDGPYSYIFYDDDDLPFLAAGIREIIPGRGMAWAVFRGAIGTRLHLRVTKMILAALNMWQEDFQRIELHVHSQFTNGKKWARLLGFEYEGTMKHYGFDGSSFYLMARYGPPGVRL